jgi:sigma-B regulation protein RsbU (phosphoserine phosphatase)
MLGRLKLLHARPAALFRKLGLLEKVFVVLAIAALAVRYIAGGSSISLLLAFAAVAAGLVVLFRNGYRLLKRVIWRLRYRLLVAYLFIAVVPIGLIVLLVAFGAEMLAGQIAGYIVTTELKRRADGLETAARGLASTMPQDRLREARWMAPYMRERYPGFEMLITGDTQFRFPQNASIESPPEGWRDHNGLLLKGGSLYLWAHVKTARCEVTLLAPMTQEALSALVPELGELSLVTHRRSAAGQPGRGAPARGTLPRFSRNRVPPPVNSLDAEVTNATPVSAAVWEEPGQTTSEWSTWLYVSTRYSAVLRTVFGQSEQWAESLTMLMQTLILALLVVELVSAYIGYRLTRGITNAVHNLYEGTQRVREGDFSHRIEVKGTDQLAELGESFNRMTENLERLVEVAKEKERLQAEIEIAREVQNQLFPRALPPAESLQLAAVCRPARLISGDYYDYARLHDANIAFAIGDVAGKGISAALLMATVQSSMRAQLRAGRELAAAAGHGGGSAPVLSTASLVTRLNQQLYAFTPPEKFATFYFALYDDNTGMLKYTNAGHLPPILIRDGTVMRLDVNGTVVGAFSFSQYGESTLQMKRGDLLVCFTDGITEPENEFGEMFGEDRLAELLLKHADREPEEIMNAVLETVRVWTGSPELQDDMTLLLARRT